jgi:hypothetical protein
MDKFQIASKIISFYTVIAEDEIDASLEGLQRIINPDNLREEYRPKRLGNRRYREWLKFDVDFQIKHSGNIGLCIKEKNIGKEWSLLEKDMGTICEKCIIVLASVMLLYGEFKDFD